MSDRILIDTNIIIDMAVQGRPGHKAATRLAREVAAGHVEASICVTSLKDVYYVLTKHMGEVDARAFTRAAMDAFDLQAIDRSVCRQAIDSNEPDFEDGLVRTCAEQMGTDFIVSRDESAFSRSRIKRVDAAEYLELVR